MEENILSDEDKSDEDVIIECEKEMQEIDNRMKKSEKRMRESEESSKEGFIPVNRRSKKLIRSTSANNNNDVTSENIDESSCLSENYEVCLFSPRVLFKQMALAKFLKKEQIESVVKIKCKSPFRVFIQFHDKMQAEKLISNTKLTEMDIRAQFTNYSTISYGIIRGVDQEITEKELLENIKASSEIISARRMKRMSAENKWIESETVRLCFKSATIPQTIEAYGLKFRVEKYIFPVTQCSRCWKYGHIRKFCALNKDVCPKCGKDHDNCDIEVFTCSNCKGPHMSLDKTCPVFFKEKMIRRIMSDKNLTCRKALEQYLIKEKNSATNAREEDTQSLTNNEIPRNILPSPNQNRSYSSVLQTTAEVHHSSDNYQNKNENYHSRKTTQNINTSKNKEKIKRGTKHNFYTACWAYRCVGLNH
ncbi:hypothetical protein ABMA27_011698 [Loxostege sticticalis]|uniref:Gag-like protein n=1 Tax=Loxostege sticticalis TaxID=481309 RepID=A0ABR3IH70_LOXSC